MSDVPGTVGGPAQQQNAPRGHVHFSVLWARCGCYTSWVSAVERAALSTHDHQRATGTRGGRCVTVCTHCVSICLSNWFSLCKYANRARPLPLIGWAVCRPLSIHCHSLKMIMSFYITYLTWCTCPASLANGWTGMNWVTGTVKRHITNNNQFLFFSFLTLCCHILLHSAAHFILTWSSICCTPWCLL